jgi:hypothetical protein
LTSITANSINDCDFLKLISVRGGHFDYSPCTPEYLAAPLGMIRDFVRILHDARTDHVRNKEVLLRIKEQRNIYEIRKANWVGHILLRNCLLPQVIEGKIKGGTEVTGRRGRRRRRLLDELKERRG